MCEELNLSPKITLSTVKKLSVDIEKTVDKETIIYLQESYTGDDYYIMLKKCFFGKIMNIEEMKCVVCGEPVKADRKNMKTCISKSCLGELYATQRGKKRPEHAKKMSKIMNDKIANGEFWNEEHRKNNRKHLNSIKMNRCELINRGIIDEYSEHTDEEIKRMISDVRRNDKLDDKNRKKRLDRFLKNKKYTDSKYYDHIYYSTLQTLDEQFKYMNSIISYVAKENNPNMGGFGYAGGYFKSSILRGLKFNNRGITTVVTKSSYETNFINFFEKNNITWDYELEEIFITYKKIKRKTIPDFYIYEDDELVKVIEVKGYIPNYDEIIEKVFETKTYYEKQGIPYYFCKMNDIQSLECIEMWSCYKKDMSEITEIVRR